MTDDTMAQPTDSPQPTTRQRLELERFVAEAQDRYKVEAPAWAADGPYWRNRWLEESRPGRGHDLSTTYVDGDHVVYISVDVYGSGSLSVGLIDRLHSSDNEECACHWCIDERAAADEVA